MPNWIYRESTGAIWFCIFGTVYEWWPVFGKGSMWIPRKVNKRA